MSTVGGNYWPHYPTPVPDRKSVAAYPKLNRKTVRLLAAFFAVPALLFIALKLSAIEFAAAKRSPGVTAAPVTASPPATEGKGSIDIDLSWSKLDPAYRAYKATIEDDNSLKLNNRPARLYGFQVIPRSKICTYANGERWACGQRAYVAMLNAMGSTTIDCREKDKGAPIDVDTPRNFICHLPGTDLAELMLRQGWGTVQDGLVDPRYVEAAAIARARQAGMWRQLPSNP